MHSHSDLEAPLRVHEQHQSPIQITLLRVYRTIKEVDVGFELEFVRCGHVANRSLSNNRDVEDAAAAASGASAASADNGAPVNLQGNYKTFGTLLGF